MATTEVKNIHDGAINVIAPSSVRNRQPWWKLGGKDYPFVSVDAGYSSSANSSASSSKSSLPIPDRSHNVWESVEAVEIYKPIEGYEGAHRFDHDYKWTPEEEKSLVRTLDWRIALPACLMFFALQLDRGNITQAVAGNMLTDLKLTTNDFNNGMTIFYCSFLFAELPSQLISKKLGPDVWIPIQMVSWSIVAAAQCKLSGKVSYYVCRSLLGLIEGGFIPDVILYLSYYYKNAELPKRLSWFWTAYQATQIVGAFLAFGILHLHGPQYSLKSGWRYLFVIEGSLTAFIGILTWLYLPASPTQTSRTGLKGFLRPKHGWFTEHQEYILVTRILLDDPGKATMHNRQGLSFKALWESVTDFDLWPIYILGLTWQIPMTPETTYITLTCKALGFSTFETNLLTIPAYTLFILQLLFWTWVSEKINQRLLIGFLAQIWVLPLLISLEVLPKVFQNSNWVKWLLTTLIIGYPYAHAIIVALTSRNSGTVRTRTVASSIYNMSVQAATIFSTQIYRNDDKPYYYRGNKVLLGILAWNIVAFVLAKAYYVYKNNVRDTKWNAMTREERLHYLKTTTDKGNKRLDFRFAS
ncbi:phthalate transporter [Myriangium duriaei CBS 260.36]|uniref:Phthalate transporter n=1 Tax=Myriangium duriaei CBS 260.36 TaxID=1168546 RepID=A0A9P4IWL9_9PEZI|nr:phthalate transporter [Myriangium duriaei CBS 260.36]